MNQAARDKIIDDLLKKRPAGPSGITLTYTIDRGLCYKRNRYVVECVPSVENFGYTDEQLFDLGFKHSGDVRSYIRKRDFNNESDWSLGGRKAGLTRRTNRIWFRIEPSTSKVKRSGSIGIYRVVRGYDDELGNIYAKSQNEALELAQLFFGYLFTGQKIKVQFIKLGSVGDVLALNQIAKSRTEDDITELENKIEEQLKEIESRKAQIKTLAMVESQQIAVESLDAFEALGDA